MGVSIQGSKVRHLTIARDTEGKLELTGNYELVGDNGVVFAKQSFNDYGGVKIQASTETTTLLKNLATQVAKDINLTLGLE